MIHRNLKAVPCVIQVNWLMWDSVSRLQGLEANTGACNEMRLNEVIDPEIIKIKQELQTALNKNKVVNRP